MAIGAATAAAALKLISEAAKSWNRVPAQSDDERKWMEELSALQASGRGLTDQEVANLTNILEAPVKSQSAETSRRISESLASQGADANASWRALLAQGKAEEEALSQAGRELAARELAARESRKAELLTLRRTAAEQEAANIQNVIDIIGAAAGSTPQAIGSIGGAGVDAASLRALLGLAQPPQDDAAEFQSLYDEY